MIVAFANSKGGVGKTTLAWNIGIAASQRGLRVRWIDTDNPQYSLNKAHKLAKPDSIAHGIKLTCSVIETLQDDVQRASAADLVIIDVAGHDNPALRVSLALADTVVVPLEGTQWDMQELPVMVDYLQKIAAATGQRKRAFGVINRVDPFGNYWKQAVDLYDRSDLLKDWLPRAPVLIHNYEAYKAAAGCAIGVTELESRRKGDIAAGNEIKELLAILVAD